MTKKLAPWDPDSNEATLADRDFWRQYGDLIGASLYGWSYRDSASFRLQDSHTLIDLNKHHVAMIEAARKAGRKRKLRGR